jgi:hypothetical protein
VKLNIGIRKRAFGAAKKVPTPASLPGVVRAKARENSRVGDPCVKADPEHQLLGSLGRAESPQTPVLLFS